MVSRFLVTVAASFLCGCTSGVVKETLDPVHDVTSLEHALRALTTQGASPTILVVVVKSGRDVFIRGIHDGQSEPTPTLTRASISGRSPRLRRRWRFWS